jgi:CRISPR/Cas system CMR-associated protein Cmr1 (group 7 of RAMP superfamily)
MSDFKVEFKLKQHTPIIHFQSDQTGATLRATELKPKLDRFLIEYVFGNEKEQYKKLLVSGQESALDYKVTISPDLSVPEDIETRDSRGKEVKNPLFFGNMGDGKDKKFKKNPATVAVTFFSFKKEMITVLKEHFEAFLANTNFGTRQSKGFGSFYLSKPFDTTLVRHKVYSFTAGENNYQTAIKDFYTLLRAGINTANFRGIYAKAVIFSYAREQGFTWDKKAIKKRYMGRELQEQQHRHNGGDDMPLYYDSGDEKLVRDLFGLSSSQQWMSYRATVTKEHTAKKIARFKSPITFKPVKEGSHMRIYFWADESVERILNETFLVKVNNSGDLKLSTPEKFSFEKFFAYAFSLDLSKHIDAQYHNNPQYKQLVRIFNEIKESK